MINGLFSCERPYINKDTGVVFTCGTCAACRRRRVQEWILRCRHELITCDGVASFVTFTYKPKNLRKCECIPRNKFDKCGMLVESDMQKLFKRMRKSGLKFKYFYCGEYGSVKMRPHYHVLFFGLPPSIDYQSFWNLGHVDVSPFCASEKTVGYITGYVSKKMADKSDKEYYLLSLRPMPYVRQSKGLGGEWADAHFDEWSTSLKIGFNGRQVSVPRYYIIRQFRKEGLSVKRIVNDETVYYKVVKNPYGERTSIILDKLLQERLSSLDDINSIFVFSQKTKENLITHFRDNAISLYSSCFSEWSYYERYNIKVEFVESDRKIIEENKDGLPVLHHPLIPDDEFNLVRSSASLRAKLLEGGTGNHHELFDFFSDLVEN